MTSTNPAEVDLVITFRASTQANAKSEAKDAETQYILLLDILQKAGFKAVGRRGKELGHLLVLVKCPEDLLKHLLKNERTSDFLSGLPSKLDAPLTPSDRIRLIQTYITSSTEQGGLGIIPSSSGQWSRVESVMALHDPDYNERWIHAWTHSKSPSGYENSLRDMFGESVALYFTFLQSYTYALIAPSVLGASFYFLDLSYSPIYSSLLLLWAIAYVEWWRIYERLVALRFGSLGHFRVEKKRPSNSRVQWWHRELRIAAGIPVILVFAGLLSVLLSAIFVFEAFLTQLYTGPLHEYVGLTPTVLFMLVVPSFMSMYEAFAQRFTAWESHAHESTHMRSLTLKTFAVSSLVKYLGLALSAFVYVPFGEVASEWIVINVPNVPADTKLTLNPARLKDQMFAFTVTQQAVGTFLEIGMPFLMRKFRGVSEKKNNGNGKRKVQFEDEKPRGGEEEQKFLERVREEAALPEYDVLSDYTEMLNQFGYVVLWSTIWPLAPVMALINNFFEIRSDAFKITVHTRRPMPVRTDTIGPWLNVLDILTWVGAMTNAVLVYLFCPRGQDQCSSSPVEKVQMHLRAHDPVHRNATLTESLLETDAGKEGVSAPWELFMKVMVIALVASHVHMVVRKLMRHGLEKVFWGSSLEVKEKEARQRGYLKKVFEESEVKGIVERGDVNVTAPEEKEFWTYDEGVEEIHRLSKEATVDGGVSSAHGIRRAAASSYLTTMSLPTSGRVLITTSAGDIDIELWAKETPKTCRNFIALAMEGYYDGVIFHRVVPNFLVQTGDRSGTGAGGESVYGEPFEDEPHPRLRYIHRGLVGMANSGKKNTNDSQFFITLDQTLELQNKNTLFGRVVGDTLYNVLKIGETELVKGTEKPVYPPTIKSIRILDNPFPDIIPRITAAEKKAQEKLRRQRDQERQKEQDLEKAKKIGKNKKLLSFDEPEEQEEVAFKKKAIVRPDLLDVTPEVLPDFVATGGSSKPSKSRKTSAPPAEPSPVPEEAPAPKKKTKAADDLSSIRKSHASAQESASTSRQQEIEALESSIRRMSKRSPSPSFEDRKKAKKSYLQEELDRYKTKGSTKKGKGKKGDELDVMATLNSFRAKLSADSGDTNMDVDAAEGEEEWDRDTASFMRHELKIEDDGNREEMDKAQNDYEVLDPLAGSSHRTATFRPKDVNVRKDVIDVRDREKQARDEERERKARDRRDKGRHGRR